VDLPGDPIGLATAFRDGLVAGRARLQERIAACRTAIDDELVIALGRRDGLPGVVTFDMRTWPGYADYFEYLGETGVGWDAFEAEPAQLTPLRAALYRFQLWQDWPRGLIRTYADKEVAERFDLPTAKQDRAICRQELELLQPERDRLDAAIAALDEYLAMRALDTAPPAATTEPLPDPDPTETPAPDPFADLWQQIAVGTACQPLCQPLGGPKVSESSLVNPFVNP
jgi:hypothetical protein